MKRIIGAFIFSEILAAWSLDEARRKLMALRDFGVNTLATESETYRDELIDLAPARGYRPATEGRFFSSS